MTTYTLQEIATLAGTSARTVRYYIELALLDRPDGETRAASYGPKHLERLTQIRRWQEAGLSLDEIREAIESGRRPGTAAPRAKAAGNIEVWSHLTLADGVELHVEPGRAGLKPEEVRKLFREVLRAYESLKKELP